MPIHPVRTREDHRAAVARIEVLMNAPAGSPEADELDILATLVDAFEAKHDPIDLPDPIAVIEFRMDQQQLSRKDLVPMIGSRGRVSEVLAGKRALTLPMIRRLASGLRVPADLLIGLPAPAPRLRPAKHPNRRLPGATTRLQTAASS
jgi:HTH-type transcriptional regulator/antitoxin HigA